MYTENSSEVYLTLKKKVELPWDPAIPLWGMYLEKTLIPKDTRTPMFIEVLRMYEEDVLYIYMYVCVYIYVCV